MNGDSSAGDKRRGQTAEPLPAGPLVNGGMGKARASAVVAVGLLFASLIGAGQAFLLVFLTGEGPATDAFLACYSVYAAVSILGVSLRRSMVPLLGSVDDEVAFRIRASELLSRVSIAAAVATLVLVVASPLLASVLTRGLPPDARRTGLLTLLVLAPAAYLQLRAGSISGVLNALHRFPLSVGLYVFSSTLALALSAALLPSVGPVGAAVGVLAGAATLVSAHNLYLRRFQLRAQARLSWLLDRGQRRLVSFLLPGSALGVAQQLNLSLALAALAGAGAGSAITSYAYGYFVVGLMSNLSSYSVALVTLPDTVELLATRGEKAAQEQLERMAPFVFAVLAPMLGAFAGFGKPLLEGIFGEVLSGQSLRLLYEVALILEPMVVALSLYVLAGTLLIALGRRAAAVASASITLVVHAVLLFALAPLGPHAVAWGHSAAALIAALAVLGATFRRSTLRVAAGIVGRVAPAFGLALMFPAVGAVMNDLPLWSLLIGLVATTTLYAVLALVLWPSVARPFLRMVPRRSTAG